MTKQLDTSPNQADASADMQRGHLRSKVSHAAEILYEQGPIGTFIHSNEDPETFVAGDDRTIDSYDMHLLHRIDPLGPAHLSWQVHREQATKRFREDLPDATRTDPVRKSHDRPSLELGSYRPRIDGLRVGSDSTELEST